MINDIVKTRNEYLLQHSFLGIKILYFATDKVFTQIPNFGYQPF